MPLRSPPREVVEKGRPVDSWLVELWQYISDLPSKEAPASATAIGTPGEIAYDSSYLYVCVAKNTWKRTTISTW